MENLNIGLLKEVGILGAIILFVVKQYQVKDNSQNKQNDVLVEHLMESNKDKDKMLKETVDEFKNFTTSVVNKMERMDSRMENIEKKIVEKN